MGVNTVNLAAMIGSRICHDLISPIGAINNGLELLQMTGSMQGPETNLIADSVDNASARIRFFRIAYGLAGDQQLSVGEVEDILTSVSHGARVKLRWQATSPHGREQVRLAFLAAQCCECALPQGGEVRMSEQDDKWTVSGTGPLVAVDPALWATLSGSQEAELTPASVQFALLQTLAQGMGKTLRVISETNRIDLRF